MWDILLWPEREILFLSKSDSNRLWVRSVGFFPHEATFPWLYTGIEVMEIEWPPHISKALDNNSLVSMSPVTRKCFIKCATRNGWPFGTPMLSEWSPWNVHEASMDPYSPWRKTDDPYHTEQVHRLIYSFSAWNSLKDRVSHYVSQTVLFMSILIMSWIGGSVMT